MSRHQDNVARAPVPEWHELALAAWPGRVPVALSAWCGRMNLVFFVVGLLVQFGAAWLKLPIVGLVAWLLPAAVDWASTRSDPPTSRLLGLFGLRPQARALLRALAAAAGVFASGQPNAVTAGLGYVTVVLFVQVAWFLQPVLATWAWRLAPPLRYLPDAAAQPAALRRYARVYARAVGTPLVLFGIEATGLVDAIWAEALPTTVVLTLLGVTISIALAEAALLYLGWTAWQAYALRRDARKTWQALLAELTELAPSFCAYLSFGARQASYLANPWLPALDRLPQDGLLLVREASQLASLLPPRHPVVYAPAPRDVERLTLPSLKAALYLAHGERNGQLLRDPRLKHILLLHGDCDKANNASRLAQGFDELWVAGPAAIDRYAAAGIDIAPDRFAVIGRPQVAELVVGPTANEPKIVLYAPTFEGDSDQTTYTSLDRMGVRLVRRLLAKHPEVQVWFRPHPASGVQRPSMLTALTEINTVLRHAGNGHLVTADDDLSLTECLNRADVLISDVSSVATDFLHTQRPIIACNPSARPEDDFAKAFPSHAASYLLGPRLDELDDALAAALGADPLKPARIDLKRHVLGDLPNDPQAVFAAQVARVTA